MSEDDFLAYQVRQARFTKKSEPCNDVADEGKESLLQMKIESYCKDRGFYFFHDRSRGKNPEGNPDLVICLPKGRTVWVECKSKDGRLSEAQKKVATQLLGAGHEWHEVRSYNRFLSIIEG
jgi:hypothetical protein